MTVAIYQIQKNVFFLSSEAIFTDWLHESVDPTKWLLGFQRAHLAFDCHQSRRH